MAFLGLRTQDAGLGGGSVADVLIKALTGDPEREMALARGRSDLELDAYRQKQMEAATAQYQAEADTKAWELNQRQTNQPVIADYYAGLVDEPVAVTTPGAVPAPAPGLPDPVAIDAEPIPLPLPDYAFTPAVAAAASGDPNAPSRRYPRQPEITAAAEPVPVYDTPFTSGPGLAPDEDTVQLPQPDVLPGEVVPPSPEEMAAYQREREAAKARANLIVAGGGNAEQVAKGVGIGEGAVMSGSDDPEMRRRAELLYAGKTAGETTAESNKVAEGLRGEYLKNKAVQDFELMYANYEKAVQAAQDKTGAGDVALLYAVMKTVDPGVAVQEGDKANAQNAMGIPDWLMLKYNNAVDGKGDMFIDTTRDEFVSMIRNQTLTQRKQIQRWQDNYREKAKQLNVDPNLVVFDIPNVEGGGEEKPDNTLTPAQLSGDEPVIRPDGSEDSSRMSAEQWDRWQKAHPADEG